MTENNDKKYGRTFFDLIAEYPRSAFAIFIVILLVAFSIIIFKPVKVGNFEIGNKSATIRDTIKIIQRDTILAVRIDTIFLKGNSTNDQLSKKHSNQETSSTVLKTKETDINLKDQPANINAGINSGIIGDNGTINNFGIQPRTVTEQFFQPFFDNFKDKNIKINFRVFGGADSEIYNVRDQIIKILNKRGYQNIDKDFMMKIGYEPPPQVMITPTIENGVIFEIPPAKK